MAEQQSQGNIREEFNLGRIGLNMDASVNQVEKGKLTYALNAALENFDASSVNYQNEQGNEFCLKFPDGYQLIGEHFIGEQNKHLFFLCNPQTGGSEIGYMDNNDCVYHTYINSDCLNFQINHPIHKAVHKIIECETEVYWTDGVNPRRYLNLNNIPYKTIYGTDGCDITTLPTIDCNKLNIQPDFSIPQLNVKEITTGGDLKAGTYQFAIQYANASGQAYTSYYSVTNPTPIANTDVTTLNFDYVVGRSIHIDISNIDVTGYFQYYNLAVIKTINAITSVELVGTYFIDSKTNSIAYTGQSKTDIRLTLNDIFEKYPYYEIADDITTARDVLIWNGLTSIDKVNLQKVANQIDLQWQTYRIPASKNYSDEIVANKYRGYLRDEVYAFEIVFLLSNGKQTDGFHIPGRLANGNDLATVYESQNKDFIGKGPTAPYWKIYNTASVSGYSPEYVSTEGYEGPYQYGDFSYWESSEEYPCNTDVWGDLAGTKIRHHKFPDASVSPIFESPSPDYNNLQMQNSAIFPIGVNVSAQQVMQLIANSDLTTEQKANIVAFKIVRGDRSTNKSIVAKGMLRNVGKYNREGTDYYFPNYPYNDLNEDPFLLTKNNAYNSQCNTFKIVATEDITLQYIDCYTGNPTATTMVAGATLRQCSLTFPVAVPSTGATITNITTASFTLTVQRETTFFVDRKTTTFTYLDPITESTATITVDYTRPQTVNTISTPVFASGSRKYTVSKNNNLVNTYCYPQNLNGFSSAESQFRYVFNSPETSFGQPYLGNVLKLENSIFGGGKSHFVSVKKHASYKLLTVEAQQVALDSCYKIANITSPFNYTAMFTAYQAYLAIYVNGVTRKNYTYSFNSVAGYDYSAPIDNNAKNFYGVLGVKQRKLDISQYIIPGVQSVGDLYSVNNFNRESSVYLKTAGDTPLPFPDKTPNIAPGGTSLVSDNSRFTASTANTCSFPEKQQDINVVSYYASLKNVIDNQWGQIYSYDTIDTGFQALLDGTVATATVFGGDTFIGKFAYKTKIPFFIDNRVGAPDDSEVFYDELGNIAYPQYWYSSRSVLSDYNVKNSISLRNIISYKAHYLDCPNDPIPSNLTTTSTTTVAPSGVTSTVSTVNDSVIYDGKMYLFAYGIPFFYVESSINVDLRQAFNSQEGDFYPHVSTGIPDNWLQESVVPIAQDNTYYYNPTFSKQNKENFFSHLPIDWTPSECYTKYPFRAIYSDQQDDDPNAKVNNWLSYSPLSFFDFPQNYGPLVSLDGIQNKAVLARFENKSLLYNTLLTIDTSNPQAAYMGNPSLFRSSPPIDFAETDLGYVGSQNKMLLKIPQGQITIDAKRGQIFLISGNQAQDLSAFGSGLNRFFTDHLAFEILRYFPTVDVDNHYNGVGLHGVYDSKFDRIIISKLDYIPNVGVTGIKYDTELDKFYIIRTVGTAPNQSTYREYIELTDNRYFCNKSWTVSFNMNSKSWVSFHSYIPNFYIAENNFFYSGLNESCDLVAVALAEIPTPTTTTTTTGLPNCALSGTACTPYPDWVNRNINSYWVCGPAPAYNQYYEQIDINPCSPTYNQTRQGALYLVNAPICGYTTTTTSSSTSSTSTTTSTTTAPNCVTSVTFDVVSAGQVSYVSCCGVGKSVNYGATGPEVINDCMQYGTLTASGATIEFISYSSTACSCTTTTTSSTTTQAPTYFYYTANYCGGGGNPGIVRFTVDQVAGSVFETDTEYLCINLTGTATGPTFNIDLGDGSGYIGNNCNVCPTPPPVPTYAQIPSYPYLYNSSNASTVGVCCQGSYLYVNSSGDFVTTPTTGYTLVEYFYVDDNGASPSYFDNATEMYANDSLTFPVPAGYYGSQAAGYRRVSGTAGQFSTTISSCAGVYCP